MHNLIIYGGTFDPIHKGHLNTAINVQNHFNFDQFIFLPCKIPVHKNDAIATTKQRIEMLKLALKNLNKNFTIDLYEINRESPSYMVDTLEYFRHQLGANAAITLLLGADSFLQLPEWHQWERLLTLGNLLVMKRASTDDTRVPAALKKLLISHETDNSNTILNNPSGFIYRFDAGNFDVSSTWIRQRLAENKEITNYLPQEVLQYIKQNNLYKTEH
ncbi:nicotinate-nucleotide adenylyltransferase [Legionella brunensis]|uniref:Probable nicotinate-nucleotide adenylyltransferase n=1 Tax=Legionella brunensis TaxID=29422 RepID=A0A0W0S4D1_9GAMM|nr:nicotinate-nucleotide adenylyltransferase [Legionella brunensis]KTC78280.1 nicotinate-nucleotide adenylyltransferase NadD [Legionella brunensis]